MSYLPALELTGKSATVEKLHNEMSSIIISYIQLSLYIFMVLITH